MTNFIATQARAWRTYRQTATHQETVNGPGSLLEGTKEVRIWLPWVFRKYHIDTMLDAPCGDWNWMAHTDLSALTQYIGWDVDPDNVIAADTRSRTAWAAPQDERGRCHFIVNNLLMVTGIPKVDLIFCRDFLQHLPNAAISLVLDKFIASGSRYLITNNYRDVDNYAYPTPMEGGHSGWCGRTEELPGYYYRPVSLDAEPFNLKGGLERIVETVAPGEDYSEIPQELVLYELKGPGHV